MKLTYSPRADRQIDQLQRWWEENGGGARSLFFEELRHMEQLLRAYPELGRRWVHRGIPVRRILLPRTKYHLYYRYSSERNQIWVLEIYGATRPL